MKIETMLHDGIEDGFNELKKIQVGTEEYKSTVDGLTKLLDRAIEIDKINSEIQNNTKNRQSETNIELEKIENDRKDRIIKNCLTAASIVCTAGITVWGSLKSWKFEETGVVTSGPGREFMRRIFHSMK
jgi:hypothetical protein